MEQGPEGKNLLTRTMITRPRSRRRWGFWWNRIAAEWRRPPPVTNPAMRRSFKKFVPESGPQATLRASIKTPKSFGHHLRVVEYRLRRRAGAAGENSGCEQSGLARIQLTIPSQCAPLPRAQPHHRFVCLSPGRGEGRLPAPVWQLLLLGRRAWSGQAARGGRCGCANVWEGQMDWTPRLPGAW